MHSLKSSLFFLFFLYASIQNVFALNPYFREVDQNLYPNDVELNSLYFSDKGLMFIASTEGVLSYDGHKFYDISNQNIHLNTKVVYVDDTIAWIGSDNSLLIKLRNINGVYKLVNSYKLKANVSKILKVSKDEFWVSTLGDGILYIKGNKVKRLINKFIENEVYIYDLVQHNDKIWLATDNGLLFFNKEFKCFYPKNINRILNDKIITSIGLCENVLFVATENSSLFELNLISNEILLFKPFNNLGVIKKIICVNNEIWMLSKNIGLINIRSKDEVYTYNTSNGFDYQLNDISIDHENNIWLSTKNNKLINFNTIYRELKLSIQLENITAIHSDKSNALWIADNNKLYLYQNNNIRKVNISSSINITSIIHDEKGRLWIGTFDKGILIYEPNSGKEKWLKESDGLINNNVLSLAFKDDTLWAATLGGVSRITTFGKKGLYQIMNFNKENGLAANFIFQVFVDSKKRVWFATDGNGVTQYANGTFKNFSSKEGLDNGVIYGITEDVESNIWLNTSKNGIYKFSNNKFLNFNRSFGIRSNKISAIIADNKESLLILNNKGVDELNIYSNAIQYHDNELGFYNFEPNLNVYSKNDNNIWFASQNKVFLYNSYSNSTWSQPLLHLNSVEINSNKYYNNFPAELKFNENYIAIDFNAIWYHEPTEIKYRYKLEGYDLKWNYTTDRHISYSQLPPGKYKLKIQCANSSIYNELDDIQYEFTVDHPFWQKYWFYTIVVITLSLLVYAIFRLRILQLKRKAEYEKERINAELTTLKNQIKPHFLFNSFNTLLGVIETDTEKAIHYVEHLSDFYRKLLIHKDENLISLSTELELLNHYVFILKQRFDDKLELIVNVQNDDLNKQVVPFTLQLLVENAIKHNEVSRAHPLKIFIQTNADYLSVKNHKQAILSENKSTGTGLQNIIKRYKFLSNKEVLVLNTPDDFEVIIPLIN